MTVGERIKAARKKAGMTQKELADKLGIPYQGISQYERGIRKPKIDTLVKIADSLGVTLEELLSTRTRGIPPSYSLPIESGMVATLDWHARKNHRTLAREIDIAIDTYLNDLAAMGELEDEYYTSEGETKREFEETLWQNYFELEEIMGLLNDVGFQKVMSFACDLTKIPEYQKDYTPPSESGQTQEPPPHPPEETPTPDTEEKDGGKG